MTRRAWLLFAAVSLLWGVPYLFIKVAVAELPPVTVVFVRVALAALLLWPVAVRRGALRGLRRRLPQLVVLSLLEITVPFLLISIGEQRIASSLAGLLIAALPLVVALLALRFDTAGRVSGLRLVGLLRGLGGGGAPMLGVVTVATTIAAVLLAPVVVAVTPARLPSLPVALALAGLGVLCTAAALLAYFALIVEAGPSRAAVVTYLNPAVAG